MANVKYFALAAVFIYSACARDALANSANYKAAEKSAPAGPPKATRRIRMPMAIAR